LGRFSSNERMVIQKLEVFCFLKRRANPDPQCQFEIILKTRCIALCSSLPISTVQRPLRLCQSKFSSRKTARNCFGSIFAFLAISVAVILAISQIPAPRRTISSNSKRGPEYQRPSLSAFLSVRSRSFFSFDGRQFRQDVLLGQSRTIGDRGLRRVRFGDLAFLVDCLSIHIGLRAF
jgi:hypothetical protein